MSFWWHLKREILSEDRNRRIFLMLCSHWKTQSSFTMSWFDFLYGSSKGAVASDGDNYWIPCADLDRENSNLLKSPVYRVTESMPWNPPPPPPAKKFWIRAWIVIKCLLSFSHVFIGFFFAVSCIKICYRVRFKQIRTVLILNMLLCLIFVEIGNN